MRSERELQISPIVQESVVHNTKTRPQPTALPAHLTTISKHLVPANPITNVCLSRPQTLTTLHNLTASLFGIGAGILGLESYPGFLFYLFFTLLTSALVYVFRVRPGMMKEAEAQGSSGIERYFRGSLELWTGGLIEGLSGFVLTWTLFYGLVRA
ncbi:hypothetical protein MBM_01431 [Drepanopeziza brunnea f. sp. 'multigermtubi' MB_m1]|uniref:ER membrane protein complex subunit 6 n=1 Tax=Marssonina brunnea f. sp. multigermtubi (strain MB_m1) TaxID=1072389 RepID=K1Y6C7_MARBU|nr:uncharacterized protein MBM_01431 [Drepanopeziza brunnea f. sp. 'multigermtubi' MB_m1]EKD20749.1 hypothetical protein MBM_01431 [Drepanopeziza brunnea f. sp. 'multigermtubi' MB_m1]